MPESKRLYRRLDPFCFAPLVKEAMMDGLRQPREKLESSDRPACEKQLPSPLANLVDRIDLMAFEIRSEIRQLFDAVIDGQQLSAVFDNDAVTRRMLNAHDALETQLL